MVIAFDSGRPSSSEAPASLPQRRGLTAPEVKDMKQQFCVNYPGELLTPATTPSVPFLAYVKEAVDTKTLSWIPWKRRSSERDEVEFTEHRRPRNDRQLIRSILAEGELALEDILEAKIEPGANIDTALQKFQTLLANALAILGACHLLVIKRFHAKFFEIATARPRDQHLKAPSLPEVIDAERAAWQNIAELITRVNCR